MKKNLITIVILALVLANLILTAVLTISILPQTKKANELITKVCAAIDLDLDGEDDTSPIDSVPMGESDTYNIEEDVIVNLPAGEDGKEHVVVMSVALIMNTKADGYKDYGTADALKSKEALIRDKINAIAKQYTMEEMKKNESAIQTEIVQALRTMYDSDFIYGVAFSKINYQ